MGRKIPPLQETFPNFVDEFHKTTLPTVQSKVTQEVPPLPTACEERPEGWWREPPFSDWILDRGHEPTAYHLIHDFVIGRVQTDFRAVKIASEPPSRLIQFEVIHPKRGTEFVRLFLSPTDAIDGPAEDEPDVLMRMNYYCLVAISAAEIPVLNAFFEGRASIEGNITAAIDFLDIVDAANGKEIPPGHDVPTPRLRVWPLGHP